MYDELNDYNDYFFFTNFARINDDVLKKKKKQKCNKLSD